MKRIFLFLLLAITTVGIYAAKSTGEPFNHTQPDGTQITVRLLGDEDFAWYQTTDGVLLTRIDKNFYIARTDSDGVLYTTGILAHNTGNRSDTELQAINAQDKKLFFNDNSLSESAKIRHKLIADYPNTQRYCPHSGTVRVPIIMMNYPDTSFTYTDKEIWDAYFNGDTTTPYSSQTYLQGYSSVSRFFSDASHGRFKMVFDIYGPYTTDNGHDYYGYSTSSGEKKLAYEAVLKADPDIDFTQYDSNNDGKVDMVYILYSGTGANTSHDTSDFWPKCWPGSLSIPTQDGLTVSVIGGANELAKSAYKNNGTAVRAGIGVTCHEMSHGMGLPDLYWVSGIPRDSQGNLDYNNCGPEDWDLMDGGENLKSTLWPCQYAAWESEILGWLDVIDLTEPQTVTLLPLNKEGGKACRVTNPDNDKEYYIIENYQNDEWNYYINSIYGSGLMITHVNLSDNGLTMTCNNTYGKPSVTLLPADSIIIGAYSVNYSLASLNDYYASLKGDPYVGTQYSGTPITSVAAYKNYTGDDLVNKYPITDITRNDDGSISFKFMGGDITAINTITDDACNHSTGIIHTVNGICVGTDTSCLPHGIYIRDGHKFIK